MGELLLLLILGGFMWLLNVFLPDWLKRRQSEAARADGPTVPPVVLHTRSLHTPPSVAPRRAPSPAVGPLMATRQRAPMRLGSRRDIRRGMVLMTILGPCRALEPPEPPR